MKNTRITVSTIALLGAAMLGFSQSAKAITITPDDGNYIFVGQETGVPAIYQEIIDLGGPDLRDICLYTQNVEGSDLESGDLAGSYTTTFSNSATDPEDALIEYDGSGNIVGPTAYLLVKDGNSDPAWYLYDLTALGWNGTDDIVLEDFWAGSGPLGRGAISHVSLYGTSVPDGGATLALLGVSLLGIGGVRKMLKK